MVKNAQKDNSLVEAMRNKSIVIDTSSLLVAGADLVNVLSDCTIVIPSIVLKELETKRTHDNVGFHARNWLRLIDQMRISNAAELTKGVLIENTQNVMLRIEPNHSSQKSLPVFMQDGSNDSTILAVAQNLTTDVNYEHDVVVMSNDVPLLIHASVELGIPAYGYSATQTYGGTPFDGRYEIELTEDEYQNLGCPTSATLNESDVLFFMDKLPEDHSHSGYVKVSINNEIISNFVYYGDDIINLDRKNKIYHDSVISRTFEQAAAVEYLLAPVEDLPIVSLGGGAGTGKTLITIAAGLQELEANKYQKIMIFRSLHEMGEGQEMGFLPGDVDDKMGPWAGAIQDAIDYIARGKYNRTKRPPTEAQLNNIKEKAKKLRSLIEVAPITYLRGRSLSNTYMVLEEAQNFSRSEILNILSRAGEGTKIVFTFDAAQVDNKFLQTGARSDIWSVVERLREEKLFAHITLKKTERSNVAELASRILETE